MNDLDVRILQRYAGGGELQKIADDLGIDKEKVTEAVDAVGFQRSRAQQLLREHDAKTRKPPAGVQFAPPGPAPAPAGAKPAANTPAPATVGDILRQADQAGGRYAIRAARIRAQIDELARDLESAADLIAAEQRVDALRRQLGEATANLRSLRTPGSPAVPAPGAPVKPAGVSNADIREWAAGQGLDCPGSGRVPYRVLEAYNAAHAGGGR